MNGLPLVTLRVFQSVWLSVPYNDTLETEYFSKRLACDWISYYPSLPPSRHSPIKTRCMTIAIDRNIKIVPLTARTPTRGEN